LPSWPRPGVLTERCDVLVRLLFFVCYLLIVDQMPSKKAPGFQQLLGVVPSWCQT
jgi:hypothetical protein